MFVLFFFLDPSIQLREESLFFRPDDVTNRVQIVPARSMKKKKKNESISNRMDQSVFYLFSIVYVYQYTCFRYWYSDRAAREEGRSLLLSQCTERHERAGK
jgi:hypothetical protein